MILEIQELSCKLAHKNTRTERHGEQEIRAHDLKFTSKCPNKILDLIDPEIRPMLFYKPVDPEGQQEIEVESDHLPALRCGLLMGDKKPYHVAYKGAGYRCRLHIGIKEDRSDDILFADCNLVGIAFKAIDGGSIDLTFTIQLYPDDQSFEGDIEEYLGDTMSVSLEAPSEEETEF